MDPDLRIRIPPDFPDTRHGTTDRKGTQLRGGAAAPCPACMAPVAPLFHPLPSDADAAGSSLHQRGGPCTPSFIPLAADSGEERRAVSPRCPRTAVSSQRPPPPATCEPEASAGIGP